MFQLVSLKCGYKSLVFGNILREIIRIYNIREIIWHLTKKIIETIIPDITGEKVLNIIIREPRVEEIPVSP